MEQSLITANQFDDIDYKILSLAAEGDTIEDSAEKLCLGISCIEKRRAKICKELDAKNMTQAVANALRTNRID